MSDAPIRKELKVEGPEPLELEFTITVKRKRDKSSQRGELLLGLTDRDGQYWRFDDLAKGLFPGVEAESLSKLDGVGSTYYEDDIQRIRISQEACPVRLKLTDMDTMSWTWKEGTFSESSDYQILVTGTEDS